MYRSLSFLLLIFILSGNSLFGQGVLKGRITDGQNGTPLVGATIVIIGTYLGGYSDEDGNYRIEGIKAGDYSIRFSYIGYAEKIFNGITLSNGETVTLDADMSESIQTLGEVEIIGERTLVDLESGKSNVQITDEDISEMSVRNVQDVVSMQVGVNETPDGIQIRGGRIYETQYLIEGINAQDPLAGTGFGVDVNANAIKTVEVITGGSDAEFGDGTSGVVLTRIKEGGQSFSISLDYRRDNLGFNTNKGVSWNTDEATVSLGGPVPGLKDRLTFFVSGSMYLSDEFFRADPNDPVVGPGTPFVAEQLHSSLFSNDSLWSPRQDNRWSNTIKLALKIRPGMKLTLTNQHSLNINQSTRTLQIIGNDDVVRPGFQYGYSLDLDNANTYAHHSNLTVLNLKGIFNNQWSYDVNVGRLFTNLRADANGRDFRDETVDQIYDPASIVTNPVAVFNPANNTVNYVYPGPGLVNNGGVATLWHDHFAEEYTLKLKFTFESANKVHYLTFGQEHKEQAYQWIDVTRPWVGAPIVVNDTFTTPSTSLGRSSDFWYVQPAFGGMFIEDEIRYKGIIAVLGVRFNYWAPGKFADDAVENPDAPVLDAVRDAYRQATTPLLGKRWKARILPKLRVSFPVTANNVLFFNYSHAMRLPHPRFLYAGLDPVYQDRSFLSNLGNPNLNPEVTVSYELGLKSQLTKDMALTISAFYNDKFDYIVSRLIEVRDQTGRFVEKTFFINQDYARIRGLEVALTRRMGKWFTGTVSGSYSIATGKSNSAAESALQIKQFGFVNATKEQYLAWDRPLDLKLLMIFKPDASVSIGKYSLEGWRATFSTTYKSGLRYTPFQLKGYSDAGRPLYERIDDQPFSKVGAPWFWADLMLSRDFEIKQKAKLSFSVELTNLFNTKSAAIVNGVTGRGYEFGDPLPEGFRDPLFPDPQDNGTPPFNPARYLPPRHLMIGASFSY
jgi:outer membrane receptor protein involved in Fe transport